MAHRLSSLPHFLAERLALYFVAVDNFREDLRVVVCIEQNVKRQHHAKDFGRRRGNEISRLRCAFDVTIGTRPGA